MKYTLLFFILSSFTLYLTSCEKAELQKSSQTTDSKVEPREIDDCTDCPVTDCCCSITLLDDVTDVSIELCGTSSPDLSTMTCEAEGVGTCPDIEGFVEIVDLDFLNDFGLFCVAPNTPFGIISSTHAVRVAVTCQVGQATPQTVVITLNTPPDKPYWSVNNNCELESCF